jgi:hypothetical protein
VRDNGAVSRNEPYSVRISSGPRWDALIVALDLAEQHLEPPLTFPEMEGGWTEELRTAILSSVREIKRDIAEKQCVRPSHYKSWIKAEMLDPRVEDARWSFALGPDGAVRDIQMAEDLLDATLSLIRDLPTFHFSEPVMEPTLNAQDKMIAILRWLAESLEAGKYVVLRQFQEWDEILSRCGVKRRVLRGISYVTRERKRLGVNIDFIEKRPSGEPWDRIEGFDKLLVNHGGMDISRHFSSI